MTLSTLRLNERDRLNVIRAMPDLEGLRGFWTSHQTNRDGDFDFYRFIISSRREVIRPHVVLHMRDGAPKAMLIGRLEYRDISIKIGYANLLTLRLRALTFIDGGTMGAVSDDESELFIGNVRASLRAGEADVAVLEHLKVNHALYQRAIRTRSFFSVDRSMRPSTHRVRKLGSSCGSFMAQLSGNERYNQRRRARRLVQDFDGKVRIDCFHDATEIGRLLRDAETIASVSYQRGLGVGFFYTCEIEQRLRLEAEKGTLRAHILYVGDRPCSFWIASLYRGVLCNDFMAFDPTYAKYAPGMYLAINVIDEVCRDDSAEQALTIDFGGGDAEWKERLGNFDWQEATVHIWAPTVKCIAANALRTFAAIAEASTTRVLRDTGLLSKVKRTWRKRIAQRSY